MQSMFHTFQNIPHIQTFLCEVYRFQYTKELIDADTNSKNNFFIRPIERKGTKKKT